MIQKITIRSFFSYQIILLIVFFSSVVNAQTNKDSIAPCPIKSFPELFKAKDSILAVKPVKNSFLLVIPVIGSSPATGFLYGAIASFTAKGTGKEDKYSTMNLGATYSTLKQVQINFKNNLLLNHNKYYLSGDWRYYIFSQDNYGLGSDIIPRRGQDDNFSLEALAEPMQYDYLKIHQTFSFLIKNDYYIGAGIHLDGYTNINDEYLDVANNVLTYHYNYNTKHGFSTTQNYLNGFSLNLLHDSRDNQVNANHGWFANINFRCNPAIGKNQTPSTTLYTEYKYYIPLSKTNLQHVLSFWTYGQFLTSGNLPYLNLPAIGWDPRSRGGKGYKQGLLRGNNLAYFETEYRFPISCNQLISGTVFANFTTVSDKDRDIKIFQYVQPAVGIGLRILIDKASRTNILLNWGWGRHSKAFYLNAGETF